MADELGLKRTRDQPNLGDIPPSTIASRGKLTQNDLDDDIDENQESDEENFRDDSNAKEGTRQRGQIDRELLYRRKLQQQGINLEDDDDYIDAEAEDEVATHGQPDLDHIRKRVRVDLDGEVAPQIEGLTSESVQKPRSGDGDEEEEDVAAEEARLNRDLRAKLIKSAAAESVTDSKTKFDIRHDDTDEDALRRARIAQVMAKQEGEVFESMNMRGAWSSTGEYREAGSADRQDFQDDAWLKELHETTRASDEQDVLAGAAPAEDDDLAELASAAGRGGMDAAAAQKFGAQLRGKAEQAASSGDVMARKMAQQAALDAQRWAMMSAEEEPIDEVNVLRTVLKIVKPNETIAQAMKRLRPPAEAKKPAVILVKKNVRKSAMAAAGSSEASANTGDKSKTQGNAEAESQFAALSTALDQLTALGDLQAAQKSYDDLEDALENAFASRRKRGSATVSVRESNLHVEDI